jgi:chaperone modulatory protein CbpM
MTTHNILTGILVEDTSEFSLGELSRACGMPAEWVLSLVEEGVIEPIGGDQAHWHFRGYCLRRVRIVQRLQSDLGINLAGAALALELLEEVETLRQRLASLDKDFF